MIVNIKKRYAYGILGLLVLAVGVFVVNAAVDKTQAWHSADQIEVTTSFCNQITGHGCGTDTNTNTWRPAQTLSVSGQTLSISSGNSVSLPGGGGWVFDETSYLNQNIPEASWYKLDLSSKVGSKSTLVLLKVAGAGSPGTAMNRGLTAKPYNDPDTFQVAWGFHNMHNVHEGYHGQYTFILLNTDSNGHIGLRSTAYGTVSWNIKLVGYIK